MLLIRLYVLYKMSNKSFGPFDVSIPFSFVNDWISLSLFNMFSIRSIMFLYVFFVYIFISSFAFLFKFGSFIFNDFNLCSNLNKIVASLSILIPSKVE